MPVMCAILMLSQLSGCAVVNSKEMLSMINAGETIEIEVAAPSYDVIVRGEQMEYVEWTQLDQLKTFDNGFRQKFDEVFNIRLLKEKGLSGKSGCLYVDKEEDRNGNTALQDALRNKIFVTKYWGDESVKSKIADMASEAYKDVGREEADKRLMASINAYYNLIEDYENPTSFNSTQSLSREQFYTLIFKAENGVRKIEVNESFESAIGGETEYSKFAQEVEDSGFLRAGNKSLDQESYKGSITRAEAVYMVVNRYFMGKFADVKDKDKAFKDNKNAGDLALKLKFKHKDNQSKQVICKDRWQSYTLAYMIQNQKTGMQEELYKAMVVAKDLGLIEEENSRWDEPISKSEAIQLVVNSHLARNSIAGYLSEVEYGELNLDKFKIAKENGNDILGLDEDGLRFGADWVEIPEGLVVLDPERKLKGGITLLEARELMQMYIDMMKESSGGELTDDDKEALDDIAGNYGTSWEEIEALDELIGRPSEKVESTGKSGGKPASKVEEKPVDKGKGEVSDKGEEKPVEQPVDAPLVFKTDKWFTKEEKEEARQRAIEMGDTDFERRAEEWEGIPDWAKESRVSPYTRKGSGGSFDDPNPFKGL